MKDLKIILDNVDDICEKFELEGLHTHPTYKQFKRLFTELKSSGDLIAAQATIAHQAQMIEHLRGGLTTGFTAIDMGTAAADGFRGGAASKEKIIDALLNHCEDGECHVCSQIICPHGDGMHFHHDGCPSCAQDEPE